MDRAVLVVDDDAGIRLTLSEILESEGYSVRTAGNGRDALRVLSDWQPHVILLDLMMPEMDGWAFLHERQADAGLLRIPVVVMSAGYNPHARPLKAEALVPKPFSIDDLLGQVESLIA
jgi:CheY-like chemotaxis protein